jgi:hypothetical protein
MFNYTMMAIIIIHMMLKSLESTVTNIHTKRVSTFTSIIQTCITGIHISVPRRNNHNEPLPVHKTPVFLLPSKNSIIFFGFKYGSKGAFFLLTNKTNRSKRNN